MYTVDTTPENINEWPLQESDENRIMTVLSHTQPPAWTTESGAEIPGMPFFSDRALFQIGSVTQNRSGITSLRCPLCQRKFHSEGNLSAHRQLYHPHIHPTAWRKE